MEWSDLEVFLAAVRAGSYTAAGRHLKVNRTTVGRRVDALEQALGAPLFDYTALGPAPTAAGGRVLAAAEVIEREIAAMLADLATPGPRQPVMRIAGSAGLAGEFLPEITAFCGANPDVPVELLEELDPLDALTQRRADLAIALVPTPPLRLAGVQLGVLGQAPYAKRGADRLAPLGWGFEFGAAIPGGQWVSANPAGDTAQQAGLITCNSWPQMKQAVLAGLGSAALWCFAGDAEPTLERLADPDPRYDSPLWLLHRSKAPPGPGLARLIAHLRVALPKRIGHAAFPQAPSEDKKS